MALPPPLPLAQPPPLLPENPYTSPQNAGLPLQQRCQGCHTNAPVIKVGFNRHIGAVILMFYRSMKGWFCKKCAGRIFMEYTLITLFFGWWGLFSFFITPFVLIYNIVGFCRSRFLPSS